MEAELSIPAIWTRDDAEPQAGRVDLTADGVRFEGGSRDDRSAFDVSYAEIASVRIGRSGVERVDGRRAVVLGLSTGGNVSVVAFDRPGSALELAHRLEQRI